MCISFKSQNHLLVYIHHLCISKKWNEKETPPPLLISPEITAAIVGIRHRQPSREPRGNSSTPRRARPVVRPPPPSIRARARARAPRRRLPGPLRSIDEEGHLHGTAPQPAAQSPGCNMAGPPGTAARARQLRWRPLPGGTTTKGAQPRRASHRRTTRRRARRLAPLPYQSAMNALRAPTPRHQSVVVRFDLRLARSLPRSAPALALAGLGRARVFSTRWLGVTVWNSYAARPPHRNGWQSPGGAPRRPPAARPAATTRRVDDGEGNMTRCEQL
jgi:hypothetical protein